MPKHRWFEASPDIKTFHNWKRSFSASRWVMEACPTSGEEWGLRHPRMLKDWAVSGISVMRKSCVPT